MRPDQLRCKDENEYHFGLQLLDHCHVHGPHDHCCGIVSRYIADAVK